MTGTGSIALVVCLLAAFPFAQQSASQQPAQAGQTLFAARCGFCHGRDAAGGENGPDLTISPLVAQDREGDKVVPVIRDGRIDKGMPGFNLPEADLAAIVAFIHDQKAKADANEGRRRSVAVDDLQTGDAEAGRRYFEGAGRCASCHSATGDLAGVATRFRGLGLLRRMLYPSGARDGRPAPRPATVTVITRAGETVSGTLAFRDEFTIGLTDASGWHRSFSTSQVTFTVNDPLDAHRDQLGKYTDDDMHNVLAYLQTLR